MPRLFAEFHVNLPGHCLFAFPDATDITYSVPLGEFQVEITLAMEKGTDTSNRGNGDPNWIGVLHSVRVTASREESELPQPAIADSPGKREYSIQLEYYMSRIELYASAAREVTNRLIRYFKFVLCTPHLEEFHQGEQAFSNATWRNGSGQVVGKGPTVVVFPSVPGMHGQLRADYLSEKNQFDLRNFLLKPKEFSVAEQMIDNARSAWFDGHLQRAVLELAIGCEVLVKRRFFAEDSPAGAAFDYLEDKAKINVKVLELVDSVALAAFRKSFKKDSPIDYQNIDYLFRCRNKIAHRGELSLRDDSANTLVPDKRMIGDWFSSVLMLKVWLSTLKE